MAFGGLILHYETQFAAAALQLMEDEKHRDKIPAVVTGDAPGGWALVSPGVPGSPNVDRKLLPLYLFGLLFISCANLGIDVLTFARMFVLNNQTSFSFLCPLGEMVTQMTFGAVG